MIDCVHKDCKVIDVRVFRLRPCGNVCVARAKLHINEMFV